MVVIVVAQCVNDLVGAFVGQEAPAEHQDDLDHLRGDRTEQQGRRQNDEQLIAQRTDRNAPDDGQFTLGGEPANVGGGDRGVIDHHAGRLRAGLRRCRTDVVNRRRGQLRQRGDVIQ